MIAQTKIIRINSDVTIGGNRPFTLLAGPCAIESEQMAFDVAGRLKEICDKLSIPFVFKSSFDKANRTSASAPRGIGMEKGLAVLQNIKQTLHVPVVTDVHETWQCNPVAEVADILQIPAFLCRQTDLLLAAAATGKVVNVKKGQFLAPWDMKNIVAKMQGAGNENILLCERGTSFGYNNLVVDMSGLVEMRQLGYPVVFDATHSVQKPGGNGSSTGGNREMVPYLMRAALAVGIDGIFAEIHPDPDHAWSDGPNQLRLEDAERILTEACELDRLIKKLELPVKGNMSASTTSPMERKRIKLLLSDIDGVMTDGGMYYTSRGDFMKKFNAHDGMGLQLLRQKGVKTGIITSEDNDIARRRFEKLHLDYLVQGQRDGGKLEAAKQICEKEHISLSEVAYIGDDVNCLQLLQQVGLAACPSDAVWQVKQVPGIVQLKQKGGQGCLREFTELIVKNHI